MATQTITTTFTGTITASGSGIQGLKGANVTFSLSGEPKIEYTLGDKTVTCNVKSIEKNYNGLYVDEDGNLGEGYDEDGKLIRGVKYELEAETQNADPFGNRYKVTIKGTFYGHEDVTASESGDGFDEESLEITITKTNV